MNLVKLGEVAEILNGFAFKSDAFVNQGTKVIKIGDINDNKVYKDNCVCIDETTYPLPNLCRVKKDDILMALSGATTGKIGIIDKELEGALVNQRIAIIRSQNQTTQKYIQYIFKGELLQKLLINAWGAAQPNLSSNALRSLEIPLPEIASQRTIAEILDKADEIVRKRKKAIALTEQLQKSIFLDMFGNPVTNPKGWEVEELNNVVSIISGQVDPKVEPFIDMLHIGGENLQSNTNNIQNIKTPRELKLRSGKYLFQSGDVLYSKIRPYLNQVVIPDFSGVCSADIYPLRVKEKKITNDFLVYLLRSKFFLDYAEKHSTRTNIPKINRPTLLSFRFPCPPINVQQKFSDKCNKTTQIQNNCKQYLTESENLFNSLLQRAFKGEL